MSVNVITDEQFDEQVQKASGLVAIDFWAEWCAPCKALAPVFAEVAASHQAQVTCYKMDVDTNTQTPARYGVRGIPTILFFKNGELVGTKVGALSKAQLIEAVESY